MTAKRKRPKVRYVERAVGNRWLVFVGITDEIASGQDATLSKSRARREAAALNLAEAARRWEV